jgi:hypothetical protein
MVFGIDVTKDLIELTDTSIANDPIGETGQTWACVSSCVFVNSSD